MKESLNSEGYDLLITSRHYRELEALSKIMNFNMKFFGSHGGANLVEKLISSAERIQELTKVVEEFKPQLSLSFCSPEACRVAFGLGIPIFTINDTPHAEKVMKLTLPLSDLHFAPWIIPYKAWKKLGIERSKIIRYKALDPFVWINRDRIPFNLNLEGKKILVRMEETQASYFLGKKSLLYELLERLTQFDKWKILVLPRYKEHLEALDSYKNLIILKEVVDGLSLLDKIDLLISSGGTMALEGALLGLPTIYLPQIGELYLENYLVKKGLLFKADNVDEVLSLIPKLLYDEALRINLKKKAKGLISKMENPIDKIIKEIKRLKVKAY